MLQKLVIKNVALIDYAEIEFSNGLNVLSGETGAGKSVILDALSFVLGAKADKSLIRSGENECFVSAVFSVENISNINDVFSELDFEYDDTLIITRKFNLDGKNNIKINGNTATVSMVKKFSSKLVDLHGQSEHYELLSNANQLKLIDKLGGDAISSLKQTLKEKYSEYKSVVESIEELGGSESQRLVRLDVLNYQIKEILSANLVDGEEDELLLIRSKMQNQEKIINSLALSKSAISDEGGISDILSNAVKSLSFITGLDDKYNEIYERLNGIYADIDDVCDTLSSYLDDFDTNNYNLDEIEDRLDLIKSLKKKYGDTFNDIQEFLANAQNEKDNLENFEKNFAHLEDSKLKLSKELYKLYTDLSNKRKACSKTFSENVVQELRQLGMAKADFSIDFAVIPSMEDCLFNSANGFDEVTFMFSANNGEPLKPLSQVISGGEMSRFMLSIKAQSAKVNDLATFVFDEIDAGISGVVASKVAEKFAVISKNVQIIAITHLPQISSMADNNLLITKFEGDDKTITTVKTLSAEDKIKEIIRLVGGSESDVSYSLAKELIDKANNFKKSIN